MTKRRWKDTLQVLHDYHFDPRKYEELNQSKKDIENKFPKILKLVKDPLQNATNQIIETNSSAQTELLELIEDFHKQYNFVYDLYDHLRGQLSQTVKDSKEDGGYFTATSSSDSESETYSAKTPKKNSTYSTQKSKINRLRHEETSSLKVERDDCRDQKQKNGNDVFTSHENLSNQLNKMKLDFSSLRSQNTELESKLSKKSREISDFLSQIGNLDIELASKTTDLEEIQKEKENTKMKVKRLESELHELFSQKSEIEERISKKDHENIQLQSNIEGLQGKMDKMGNMLKEREDRFLLLQKKLENGGEDKSAHIVALTTQINHLERELESKNELEKQITIHKEYISKLNEEKKRLQSRILELEKNLEVRRDEFSELENEMSNQIRVLNREVSHLQQGMDMKRKLDEQVSCQDKVIGELRVENESLLAKILELEITLTEKEDQTVALERRVRFGGVEISELSNQISRLKREMSVEKQQCEESMARMEEHNKELIGRVADQQVILKQQEDTLNKFREDCKRCKGRLLQATDRKMDEVVEEFRKNFEDKLRLLSRRIRVSEQLHSENKEQCKKLKERCDKKHPALEKRLLELMSTSKVNLWKLSETIEGMMKGMEKVVSDFERKEESYEQRMLRVLEDVRVAKNWVRWTMDEMKPKSYEPQGSPFSPFIMDEKEQDKVLKEKVKKLEARVNKEKGDKLRLMRGAYELQKKAVELEKVVAEKDERLLRLSKEKIEAIRQLCMWIDYHKSRFDQVKDMLVKRGKFKGRH